MPTSTVDIGAGTLTVDADGPSDGPLVVLLHGFPQSRHTWRAQIPALASAGFRAVAPDQRGYSPGLRPDPSEWSYYAIDRLVADVLALADALGGPGSRIHLVGHDWGGAVSWAVADRYPERLHTLTVLSRPHPGAFAEAMRGDADGQRERSRHHRGFLDAATGPRLLDDDARRLRQSFAAQGVPAAHAEEYLSVLGKPDALEAALAWYRAAGSLAGLSAGPIGVPTLYLWGDADATVGPTAARGTHRYVTGRYRFVEIGGGGHFLTDDHPSDVTAALLDWLRAPG
jgi:pimeloyl-ACP methyl ester carboxylesterase